MKKIVVFVVASLVFTGLACASIIPVLDAVPVGAGPTYTWSYTAHVSGDEQLNPTLTAGQCGSGGVACPSGTYFTLYDIVGFSGLGSTPGNWTATTQLVGVTPTLQGGTPDSGSLTNITYFYTGPAIPAAASTSDLLQSPFTFLSTSKTPVLGYTTYNATKFANPNGVDQGVNQVMLPGLPAGIPEPASMLLIGGGLVGLALLRRRMAIK